MKKYKKIFKKKNCGRKVKVNWTELNNIGNDTTDLVITLEKARLKIKLVLDTMDEAWEGIDATNYKNSYYNLLDYIDTEIKLLLEWSDYFKNSAKKYSSTQEQTARDIDTLKANLEAMATREIEEEEIV